MSLKTLVACLALAYLVVYCASSVTRRPTPQDQVPTFIGFDRGGNPLVGARLYSYEAGSFVPLSTFADITAKDVPNPNPVMMDSRGHAVWPIYLAKDRRYRFVLMDADTPSMWPDPDGRDASHVIYQADNIESAIGVLK